MRAFVLLGIALLAVIALTKPSLLGAVISIIIGAVVLLFIAKFVFAGLAGAAGMVDGIACLGCGSLFLGIVVLIIISAVGGFFAGIVTP